jgi:hypothetical protein
MATVRRNEWKAPNDLSRSKGRVDVYRSDDPLNFHRLWASVITQAAVDLFDVNATIRNRARRWFDSQSEIVGSLNWICRHTKFNERLIADRSKHLKSGDLKRKGSRVASEED